MFWSTLNPVLCVFSKWYGLFGFQCHWTCFMTLFIMIFTVLQMIFWFIEAKIHFLLIKHLLALWQILPLIIHNENNIVYGSSCKTRGLFLISLILGPFFNPIPSLPLPMLPSIIPLSHLSDFGVCSLSLRFLYGILPPFPSMKLVL